MVAPVRRSAKGAQGFTLLEVLVAVAILSISLTSLLQSQVASLRATEEARMLSTVSFLAEYQLIDIEWQLKVEAGAAAQAGTGDDTVGGPGISGWGSDDRTFDGDFADQGWPNVTYECVVDLIEMPDYTALAAAADAAGSDDGIGGYDVQDAGEQTFDTLGMVWPIVKEAIENSIRKSWCTVRWNRDPEKKPKFNGSLCSDEEVTLGTCLSVATFWTNPSALTQLPSLGGETTEEDDTRDDDGSGGNGAGGGGGRGGGNGGGGGGKINPAIQPVGGQAAR